MEYRVSFLLGMLANAIDFLFGLIQYCLFFSVAKTIAGWEMPQMLTLYGVFMTIFSLHFMFLYPNLDSMSQLVNGGQLDLFLTKPVSSQIILSFKRLSFEDIGSLLTSQALLWGLILTGSIKPDLIDIGFFFLSVACSLSLVYCLFLFFLALTVWFEKMDNLSDLLWSFFGLCRYPVDIFPRKLKMFFWTLFPVAFITSVPANALLGRMSGATLAWGCLLTIFFLGLSRFFWCRALAGYTSAGG